MIRGVIQKFNRGEVGQEALARDDVKRINNSASSMVNFIPSRLGNMIYRPGTEYIAELDSSSPHRGVDFVKAVDDTAVLDFYNDKLEFVVNDVQISATAVTSAFANGLFTTDIASWTDASGGSATTAWYDYGTGDGALALTGDGSANAVSYQTIGATDTGVEHSMRVIVERTPVVIKIGTTGASSYDLFTGTLKPGEHVLTFTPSVNVTVTFENSKKYRVLINSISFDSAGSNLAIETPLTAATLGSLRTKQSGDVVFCAFDGGKQFQVEHRGDKSWSAVDFRSDDGPFESINSTNITLAVAALNGDTTLSASEDFFEADHVGALFKAASTGQKVTASVAVDTGAGTGSIRVTGVSSTRAFTIIATGFATATVTLQRSADDVNWDDVQSYTTNQNKSFNDGFDNSIFYYRLYVKAGDNPGPDTLSLELDYASGSIEGICRVTEYTSATVVNVQVLTDFGSTDATLDWYEGSWSAVKQYPAALDIDEGRLWFSGKEEGWGSVSDSYYSFDRSIEGDSASILRTIGFGPSDPIKWIMSSGQLILGTSGGEVVIRSSSFGEVLTPSTANVRSGSNQGSANVEPTMVDNTIYFVQRSGIKLYSLTNYVDRSTFDTVDSTLLNQEICSPGINRVTHTRQPETRIFASLDNGNAAVYTVDVSEEVAGWNRFNMEYDGNTNGLIKDVTHLPETDEDRVYFVVQRGLKYYLEKMAKFKDSIGGVASETFDSFKRYTLPGLTIAGLSHLEGYTVGVWADSQDRGTYTVSGGEIEVAESWENVIVGIPYVSDYVSNKISGYEPGTVLTERKRIVDVGLVLKDTWPGAIKLGPNTSLLKDMPGVENGTDVDTTATIADYSELPFDFDGETEVDPRIYIRATGPCTILACTYGIEETEEAKD